MSRTKYISSFKHEETNEEFYEMISRIVAETKNAPEYVLVSSELYKLLEGLQNSSEYRISKYMVGVASSDTNICFWNGLEILVCYTLRDLQYSML